MDIIRFHTPRERLQILFHKIDYLLGFLKFHGSTDIPFYPHVLSSDRTALAATFRKWYPAIDLQDL